MSYDMLRWDNYSAPRPKQKKAKIISVYLLVSIIVQMLMFFSVDKFLSHDSSIDIEPEKTISVSDKKITLDPTPSQPGLMSVSADRSRLAVVDADWLRIYDLKNGKEILNVYLKGETPGAMEWLPDRNRLIFALLNRKFTTEVIKTPVKRHAGRVFDETYSTDKYRIETTKVTKEGFQIAVFSVDDQPEAKPELIQTLRQSGVMPDKVDLNLSTYTNLLYVHWQQGHSENLVQIDIMKRIKDINLPKGKLSRLLVSPQSGTLWAEMIYDNSASIYKYHKGRWKFQKQLDGYRLIGVTPDDQLAVSPDLDGTTKQVFTVSDQGDMKPDWAFSKPLTIKNMKLLSDGRLLYLDKDKVILHSRQIGKGTIYNIGKADGFSTDGKMVVSWLSDAKQLRIMEEIEEVANK